MHKKCQKSSPNFNNLSPRRDSPSKMTYLLETKNIRNLFASHIANCVTGSCCLDPTHLISRRPEQICCGTIGFYYEKYFSIIFGPLRVLFRIGSFYWSYTVINVRSERVRGGLIELFIPLHSERNNLKRRIFDLKVVLANLVDWLKNR